MNTIAKHSWVAPLMVLVAVVLAAALAESAGAPSFAVIAVGLVIGIPGVDAAKRWAKAKSASNADAS